MASTSKLMAELIAADGTVDVANTDITGTLITAQIADGAVTSAKLDATYLTPTGDGSGLSGIAGGFFQYGSIYFTRNMDKSRFSY